MASVDLDEAEVNEVGEDMTPLTDEDVGGEQPESSEREGDRGGPGGLGHTKDRTPAQGVS